MVPKITLETIIFAMLAGSAALASVGVVAFKNATRSALCLVFNFFVLGFLYFSLQVEMLGITQIVVYTGAIMVLFIFVIMLLNLGSAHLLQEKFDAKKPVGIFFGVSLAVLLSSQIVPLFIKQDADKLVHPLGDSKLIGQTLFTTYVFPFEAVSFLLLVGIVGSIMLAKRRIS
jgi:NADH-quinone oxidoreductase subunit J